MSSPNEPKPKPEGSDPHTGGDVADLTPPSAPQTARGGTNILPATIIGPHTPHPVSNPATPLPSDPRYTRSSNARHAVGVAAPRTDLMSERLLRDAPRIQFQGATVPSLGGIPLLAKLGQGGMAAVYYGVHPRLQLDVAVKVLPFHMADQDSSLVERFIREAQVAAQVRSPNLVHVYDVNQDSGLHFLIMEFVQGNTAGKQLRFYREQSNTLGFPVNDAIDVCIGACRGLAAAHREGIIHRDVKPDNIMIPRASIDVATLNFASSKLMDLGLARVQSNGDGNSGLTATESAMGTPGYMAPEQALDAHSADHRSDIFSMGATLYAMLAGRSPFDREKNPMKAIFATAHEPAPLLHSVRPDVSELLSQLIDTCLAKEAGSRVPSVDIFLAELEKCKTGGAAKPAQKTIVFAANRKEEVFKTPPNAVSLDAATPFPNPPLQIPIEKKKSIKSVAILALTTIPVASYLAWIAFRSTPPVSKPSTEGPVAAVTVPSVKDRPHPAAKKMTELGSALKDVTSVEALLATEDLLAEIKRLSPEPTDAPVVAAFEKDLKIATQTLELKESKKIEESLASAGSLPPEQAKDVIDAVRGLITSNRVLARSASRPKWERDLEEMGQRIPAGGPGKATQGTFLLDEVEKLIQQGALAEVEKKLAAADGTTDTNRLVTLRDLYKQKKDAAAQTTASAWLKDASLLVDKGELEAAQSKIREAEKLDGSNPGLDAAWRKLSQKRGDQQRTVDDTKKQEYVNGLVMEVRSAVIKGQNLGEAEARLLELQVLAPADPMLAPLEKMLKEKKEDRQRRKAFESQMAGIASDLAKPQPDLTAIQKALREAEQGSYSKDPQLAVQWQRLEERRAEATKRQQFGQLMVEATGLLDGGGDWQAARKKLEAAQGIFSDDPLLAPAWKRVAELQKAELQKAAEASRRAETEQSIKTIGSLVESGSLDEADRRLGTALSQNPAENRLLDLKKRIQQKRDEALRRESERKQREPEKPRAKAQSVGENIPE